MKIYNKILFSVIIIGIFFWFHGFAVERVQQQRHKGPAFTDGQTVLKLYQIMKDVHEVLQLKKVQYWAMGGTLLGAVRHHGLIPWDDDLDICIDKKQINDFASLQPIFESLGYEVSRRPFGYKIILIEKNQAKTKAKIFMDVFLYEQKGNKIYYLWRKFRYPREDKGVPIYANELYPLKDYEFGSLIIKGPNNPYNYLFCCYGKQCLNVANYGGGHNPHLRKKYGKFRLSVKDKAPAMPTGPLQDRVLLSRACDHCSLEVVQFDKDSPEKSRQVLASLCPVFIRSFEKQSELQLKEEHPNEYIALNKAGMTIRDVLLERFNKIVETVLIRTYAT